MYDELIRIGLVSYFWCIYVIFLRGNVGYFIGCFYTYFCSCVSSFMMVDLVNNDVTALNLMMWLLWSLLVLVVWLFSHDT